MKLIEVTTRDGITMLINTDLILTVSPTKFPNETVISVLSADSNDYYIVRGEYADIKHKLSESFFG